MDPGTQEQQVTPLELFFDLVFVFAITQVSGFVSDDATWTHLLEGLAIMAVLGWAWGSYARPGHTAGAHEGASPGVLLAALLGESIVSLGLGAGGLDLGARVIAGALLGVATAAALWWAYFDVVAIVAERRLREAPGDEQVRIARDSYTYLHFPMVAGIVVFAVGVKRTLEEGGHLQTVPATALC